MDPEVREHAGKGLGCVLLFVAPYLVGVVTAPLATKIVEPLVRGTAKATVGIVLETRKSVAGTGAEI